jgi:hypothetical protein
VVLGDVGLRDRLKLHGVEHVHLLLVLVENRENEVKCHEEREILEGKQSHGCFDHEGKD